LRGWLIFYFLIYTIIRALPDDVKDIISSSMESAYNATSCAMVLTYWNVGRRIVEQEQDGNQRAEYGTAMMDALAAELTKEYRNRQRICFAACFFYIWSCLICC